MRRTLPTIRRMERTIDDLIYDVGMHNGNDTAFYLACGFRVVAIEADPSLAAAGRARFKDELESGRLILLNNAIADHDMTAEFWVNEAQSQLNSFSREMTARFGHAVHSIQVRCRRLNDILGEYGKPYYLKIDIEGNDIVCCNQLTPDIRPPYISVEMSQMELLLRLRDLGYDRFKLITQLDLHPVEPRDTKLHVHALRTVHHWANHQKHDKRFSQRLARKSAALVLHLATTAGLWGRPKPFKSARLPDWNFVEGCSGTFGEDLPGEWLGWEQIAHLWHRDLREYQKMGQEFWCDIHATSSS
jgi:FkbM family methyltransferase